MTVTIRGTRSEANLNSRRSLGFHDLRHRRLGQPCPVSIPKSECEVITAADRIDETGN